MRKVLRNFCVGLFICLGCRAVAQNYEVLNGIDEFTFYGVDYAQVRVFGAREAAEDFVEVFPRINQLLLSEPEKYRVGKRSKKKVKAKTLSAVRQRNQTVNIDSLLLESTNYYVLFQDQIEEEIKSLPLNETEGIGLVVIAELLDKSKARGLYHVVFFDVKTRNIIETWRATGKAGGLGLRNYWANSLVKVLRNT